MSDPLATLKARFVDRSRQDLARLRDGVQGEELTLLVHRLAGIAGSFGFVELGEIASRIDRGRSEGLGASPADLDRLMHALEGLLIDGD